MSDEFDSWWRKRHNGLPEVGGARAAWDASASGKQELLAALHEILRVHANDDTRPKAFYIAANALMHVEGAPTGDRA